MSRGNDQAEDASKNADAFASQNQSNAQGIYSTLAPELAAQASDPQGFTPEEKAAMDTSAQQSVGGSQAAAVGQGALLAGRTKNAGTADAAIADAARSGAQTLSQDSLKTEMADAQLKQQKQQAALSEEGSLYGTGTGAAANDLGEVANNVNANSKAEEESWNWAKYVLDPTLESGGQAAKALGCWIAEAVYGVEDPRTHIVRAYLNGPFRETLFGSAVMALYLAIGEKIAAAVRRSTLLRKAFLPLFNLALRKALNGNKR